MKVGQEIGPEGPDHRKVGTKRQGYQVSDFVLKPSEI